MDSVRFGRALGIGARSAAKALAGAVDAAAAPNPSSVKPPAAPASSSTPGATETSETVPGATGSKMRGAGRDRGKVHMPSSNHASRMGASFAVSSAARTAALATVQARTAGKNVAQGGKRFGEAVWGPLVNISGVLWFEITGAFFGLFALFAGQAAWTHRSGIFSAAADRDARVRAFVFLFLALLFAYFCVSSFFRARRRGRRS